MDERPRALLSTTSPSARSADRRSPGVPWINYYSIVINYVKMNFDQFWVDLNFDIRCSPAVTAS